jgi:hypothetical protein
MGERVAVPRALWGFGCGGWGFEVRAGRSILMIVDLSADHWGVVEVFACGERRRSAGRLRSARPIRASAAMAGL